MNALLGAVIPKDPNTLLAASSSVSTNLETAIAAASSASTAASSTAAAAAASTTLTALTSNTYFVGSAWILSSAVLTTFSTTSFLKFGQRPLPFVSFVKPKTDEDSYTGSENDNDNASASLPLQQRMEEGAARPSPRRMVASSSSSSSPLPVSLTTLRQSPAQRRQGQEGASVSCIPRAGVIAPAQRLSRPALLTLYRFGGSLLLGLVAHSQLGAFVDRVLQTWRSLSEFALPAAFLFLANFCNSISLNRIGISLTYTSKCGIPLLTVLLTLLLDGRQALPSMVTLLTLIPIAVGIGMASWNSPTFETLGFVAAMISSAAQAALNVCSKRAMSRTGITGADAQRSMVAVALCFTMGTYLYSAISSALKSNEESLSETMPSPASVPRGLGLRAGSSAGWLARRRLSGAKTSAAMMHPPLWITVFAIVSYHIEYVLSFMFIRLVEPITFGTCDAVRRLSIIIAGRRMFGGEVFSTLNLTGIGLAVLGATAFSFANGASKR